MTQHSIVTLLLVCSCVVVSTGCVPEFEENLSLVDEPQLIAVRAEPAEAAPGAKVTLSGLVAGRGSLPTGVSYSFCKVRKPLSELGPIDPACVAGDSKALESLGRGLEVEATIPNTACQLFGPLLAVTESEDEADPATDSEPEEGAGRPTDPDPTGGYYQPVIAALSRSSSVLGAVRLQCGLPRVSRATLIEFNQRFRPNANPEVQSLALRRSGSWVELPDAIPASGNTSAELPDAGTASDSRADAATADDPAVDDPATDETASVSVRRGAEVRLQVRWPTCPTSAKCGDDVCSATETAAECPKDCSVPRGCPGEETYLTYDTEARELRENQEEFVVSWFATHGKFDTPRSGPLDASARASENRWIAPNSKTRVQFWVVLRDGRGGIGFRSSSIQVE